MSPLEVVAARYEGRIPSEAWRAACAAMATWKPDPVPSPAKPEGRSTVTARQIAEVMIARAVATGACTEADLSAAGFTAAELQRHGEAARALARRALGEVEP